MKTVAGWGEADVVAPQYQQWAHILRRRQQQGCIVYRPWQKLSNFTSWSNQFDWEGKVLDVSLLGDGRVYSPGTCVYLPHAIARAFHMPKPGRYLPGVSFHKGRFLARVREGDSRRVTGTFTTEHDAFEAYVNAKTEFIRAQYASIDARAIAACECKLNQLREVARPARLQGC